MSFSVAACILEASRYAAFLLHLRSSCMTFVECASKLFASTPRSVPLADSPITRRFCGGSESVPRADNPIRRALSRGGIAFAAGCRFSPVSSMGRILLHR